MYADFTRGELSSRELKDVKLHEKESGDRAKAGLVGGATTQALIRKHPPLAGFVRRAVADGIQGA